MVKEGCWAPHMGVSAAEGEVHGSWRGKAWFQIPVPQLINRAFWHKLLSISASLFPHPEIRDHNYSYVIGQVRKSITVLSTLPGHVRMLIDRCLLGFKKYNLIEK